MGGPIPPPPEKKRQLEMCLCSLELFVFSRAVVLKHFWLQYLLCLPSEAKYPLLTDFKVFLIKLQEKPIASICSYESYTELYFDLRSSI